MNKIAFIDRDGTVIEEPEDEQVDALAKIRFVRGVIPALLSLIENGYKLVMVTNQDGLGTTSFPQKDFEVSHEFVLHVLESQGVCFEEVCIDTSFERDNSPNRKPAIGLVLKYLRELDMDHSFVVGDRESDLQFAANLGIRGFKLGPGDWSWPSLSTEVVSADRVASVERNTNETRITASINLDSPTPVAINTGLAFFDHMLEQIARHGGFALTLSCEGDLNVDEHHTIEDTGLVLGDLISKALTDKRGIERYGFTVPMDEALSTVVLDLSGRSFLKFEGSFDREYVGDFPTEMVTHFFRSLTDSLRATLHISVQGENTHHKVEAAFKGFARTLRSAVRRSGSTIPSSKGVLS